jgi:enoyl-CoA hydratase/carnithine racemase
LLASGRRVETVEALALGLVSRVADDQHPLAATADALAAAFAGRSRAVVGGIKSLSNIVRRELHERLAATEEQHFVMTWTHEDHWRAAAAAARGSG